MSEVCWVINQKDIREYYEELVAQKEHWKKISGCCPAFEGNPEDCSLRTMTFKRYLSFNERLNYV